MQGPDQDGREREVIPVQGSVSVELPVSEPPKLNYSKPTRLKVHSSSSLRGVPAQEEDVSRREISKTRPDGTFIAGTIAPCAEAESGRSRQLEQLTFQFSFPPQNDQATQSYYWNLRQDGGSSPPICWVEGNHSIAAQATVNPPVEHSAPVYRIVLYHDAKQRAARLALFEKVLEHAKSLPW